MLSCLAEYDVFVGPPVPDVPRATPGTGEDGGELDEVRDFERRDAADRDNLTTSLRSYRGPGMVAAALFCAACCLRTWRRNSVACDELLFLPGTPHEGRGAGAGAAPPRAAHA